MNVGDMVRIRKGSSTYVNAESVGIIIETRTLVTARGNSTKSAYLSGKNINTHEVFWPATGKITKMMESVLEEAV